MKQNKKYTEIMKQLNYKPIGSVLLRLGGVVSTCCEPVGEGFYLGTSCPKCKQPFRQNLK